MDTTLTFQSAPLAPFTTLPADRHPVTVYLAGLAPGSRRTMAGALSKLCKLAGGADPRDFPWWTLRYQHTCALRASLAQSCAPAYANKVLSALRGVLAECRRLGLMSAEDCAAACDVRSVKGTRLPKGRALSPDELRRLFAACDARTPGGARDVAMLAVLVGGGLRRAEVVGLDLADFTPDTGELTVHGKGNKQRCSWATNGALAALTAWLAFRGPAPGPLFLGVTKSGIVEQGRRLTTQAVWAALARLADRSDVPPCAPHDMRRTFVSALLEAGVDLVTVQHLAGHANIATTARYDRRGEAAQRNAAAMIHVPFKSASVALP